MQGRRRQWWGRDWLPLVLGGWAFLVLGLWGLGALQGWEASTLDYRFWLRYLWESPRTSHPQIAIVGIDEPALARYGRWPWPRARLAELVTVVARGKPRALGLDFLFLEPEGEGKKVGAGDQALARSLNRAGRVVLPCDLEASLRRGWQGERFEVRSRRESLAPLRRAAAGRTGHLLVWPDRRGVVRAVPVFSGGESPSPVPSGSQTTKAEAGDAEAGGKPLPFSLALLAAGGEADRAREATAQAAAHRGRLLLNFQGPERYQVLSAAALLEGRIPPATLAGKFVLIGITARGGAGDQHLTPLTVLGPLPGVYLHAEALRMALEGDYLRQPSSWLQALLFLIVFFAGVIMAGRRRWQEILGVGLLLGSGLASAAVFSFIAANFVLPAAPLFLLLAGDLGLGISHAAWRSERAREDLEHLFARYLSPQAAREIAAQAAEEAQDPGGSRLLRGQRRDLSVFLADLRGFTALSARQSPEETVALLNRYLQVIADIIWEYGGMVDKFMGDAVLALFGAPRPQPDHALRAVRAAVAVQRYLREDGEGGSRGRETAAYPLAVGIAITSGVAVVGSIGSPRRRDYTAIGPPLNLAARLEGITPGGEIYLDAATAAALQTAQAAGDVAAQAFTCVLVGEENFPGLSRAERIYRVDTHTTATVRRHFSCRLDRGGKCDPAHIFPGDREGK